MDLNLAYPDILAYFSSSDREGIRQIAAYLTVEDVTFQDLAAECPPRLSLHLSERIRLLVSVGENDQERCTCCGGGDIG